MSSWKVSIKKQEFIIFVKTCRNHINFFKFDKYYFLNAQIKNKILNIFIFITERVKLNYMEKVFRYII